MNTNLVNSAAGVINAALTQNRTAAGIALALESAQMLMTPETAAELEKARLRVDEVERKYTFDTAELKRQLESARVDGQRLRAERAEVGNEIARFGIYGAALPAAKALVKRADELVTENAQLRARVAGLEAERHSTNEALDDAVQELRRRQTDAAPKCRCDEPNADPYACEAEDCTGEFPELNPFGGGPVQGHDAKVSRTCGCGWRTSEWYVADGSAEEELHGHVTSVHGGVYPQKAGA